MVRNNTPKQGNKKKPQEQNTKKQNNYKQAMTAKQIKRKQNTKQQTPIEHIFLQVRGFFRKQICKTVLSSCTVDNRQVLKRKQMGMNIVYCPNVINAADVSY